MAKANEAKNANVNNANSDVNTWIKTIMENVSKDGKAMVNMVQYMFDNEANYGPTFVKTFDKKSGSERTDFIDATLSNLSPYYSGVMSEIKKAKDKKEKTDNDKVKLEATNRRRIAAHTMFKNAIKCVAYLHEVKAFNFKPTGEGVFFQHDFKEEKARPEIMSGRTLTALGAKLLKKGESNRTGTGKNGAAASAGQSLKASLEFAANNLRNEKGALTDLSDDAEAIANRLLVTLIERQFVSDGEVKMIEVSEWIKEHMTGIKVDGRVKQKTAKEAEETLHKDARKSANGQTGK